MATQAAMVGMNVASGLLSKRRKKGAEKRAKKVADLKARYLQSLVAPENYNKLAGNFRSQFQAAYEPQRRRIGDVLALNEQGAQGQFSADAARRGLSGSGLAFAGQNSIRAARMAGLGEVNRAFQTDIENAVREASMQSIRNQLEASGMGTPYDYEQYTGPTGLETFLGTIPGTIGQLGQYSQLTGGSGNLGSLLGLSGGPQGPGFIGPQAPYYLGQNVGRG